METPKRILRSPEAGDQTGGAAPQQTQQDIDPPRRAFRPARSGPLKGKSRRERLELEKQTVKVWVAGQPICEDGQYYEKGDDFETTGLRRIKLGPLVSDTPVPKPKKAESKMGRGEQSE